RREPRLAQERAEAAIAVSTEHGLMMYQAHAAVTHGWALVEQGRHEDAIEQMRQGLAARRATGTELMRPHLLAQLAEALATASQPEEGLRTLDEALAIADRNGERCYEAELYRLKGELLLAKGGKTAVAVETPAVTNPADCFNQSLRIAQRQKAKSLE